VDVCVCICMYVCISRISWRVFFSSVAPCLRDLERVEGNNCTVSVLLDTAHSKAVEDEEDAIELQGSGC
jgi:hypothetical protein